MKYNQIIFLFLALSLLFILGCSENSAPGEDSIIGIDKTSVSRDPNFCTEKCHAPGSFMDPIIRNSEGIAGKHVKHVGERGFDCQLCHQGYQYAETHRNGIFDIPDPEILIVNFDPARNPVGKWINDTGPDETGKQTGGCADLYCHGGINEFEWYEDVHLICTDCHTPGSNIDPLTTSGSMAKGKHIPHVQKMGVDCQRCHENYPKQPSHANGKFGYSGIAAVDNHGVSISKETERFLYFGGDFRGKEVDVEFAALAPGSCENIVCHGGQGGVNWYLEKEGCHTCHQPGSGVPIDPVLINGSGLEGKHERHVIRRDLYCTKCHLGYNTKVTELEGKKQITHMNGIFDALNPNVVLINFDETNPDGKWVEDEGTELGKKGGCTNICHDGGKGTEGWYAGGGYADGKVLTNENFDCTACHNTGSHSKHLSKKEGGPRITCADGQYGCHGPDRKIREGTPGLWLKPNPEDLPIFFDGQRGKENTQFCDKCHSLDEFVDGVNPQKKYWYDQGDWMEQEGIVEFCGSCHDNTSGQNGKGKDAPSILGDKINYGFMVTGHGKKTGNYGLLSYQKIKNIDGSATDEIGNPAAGRICSDCHDLNAQHFFRTDDGRRLKEGFENDDNNSVCSNCHGPAWSFVEADAAPKYFDTMEKFTDSAHGPGKGKIRCIMCHEPHGMGVKTANPPPAMTKDFQENLCFQCHKNKTTPDTGPGAIPDGPDGIRNYPISKEQGAMVGKDSIEEVFKTWGDGTVEEVSVENDQSHHNLGTIFEMTDGTFANGSSMEGQYRLECISCHNVHVVTGKFWEADQNLTPVTRFTDKTEAWGDDSNEKMSAYAASKNGVYATPVGTDTFTGDQLPDYPTFCLDCHGPSRMWTPCDGCENGYGTVGDHRNRHGGINWDNDNHGGKPAKIGHVSDQCPDWWTCGMSGSVNASGWPKIPRGRGNPTWTRPPYDTETRFMNGNFVLSCTNCHDPHGSPNRSMIRTSINDYAATPQWSSICNRCHNYYGQWHSGMSCGAASCHETQTGGSQRMGLTNTVGSGQGTLHEMGGQDVGWVDNPLAFNRDLVADIRFDGNLKDLTQWRMHGAFPDSPYGNGAPGASYTIGVDGLANSALQLTTQTYTNANCNDDGSGVGSSVWLGRELSTSPPTTPNNHLYFEMKYNLTLEAWINPAAYLRSDPSGDGGKGCSWESGYADRILMTNANILREDGEFAGNYQLALKHIDGAYRLHLMVNVSGGVDVPACDLDGAGRVDWCGWRGAYSSAPILLNEWTHVAATYDASQYDADRNPDDLTQGRIRIYVNGKDVTWSRKKPETGTDDFKFAQPADGEGEGSALTGGNGLTVAGELNGKELFFAIGDTVQNKSRMHFIGKIDNLKVWNITKSTSYFEAQVPPELYSAGWAGSHKKLLLGFKKGVYSDGSSDLNDTNDFSTTIPGLGIAGIEHTAGDSLVILTMDATFDLSALGSYSVTPASNAIFDQIGAVTPSLAMMIAPPQKALRNTCPTGDVLINLNEPAGSLYVFDDSGRYAGTVNATSDTLPGDGTIRGQAIANNGPANQWIRFDSNSACLNFNRAFTVETVIKPFSVDRDSMNSYTSTEQIVVQRENSWLLKLRHADIANHDTDMADLVFQYFPINRYDDCNGGLGSEQKQVSTDWSGSYKILATHWYHIKVVFNADKRTHPDVPGSTTGIPVDIFVDDMGTDKLNADEKWSGFKNISFPNAGQSADCSQLAFEGDEVQNVNGDLVIGAGADTKNSFDGWIDWIKYNPLADYSAVGTAKAN